MDQEKQSRWQPTRTQLLWASATAGLLTIAILIGYRGGITLWDWIKLLVVPAVIAAGGFWFNRQQREREIEIAREQRERDVEMAERRAQDDTLQAYLDGMSQLLTDKEQPLHRAQSGDSLSTVARARTLTVLGRLDSGRKRSVMQFLYESRLLYKEHTLLDESDRIERRHNIVSLQQADLREAKLYGANLSRADLRGIYLREADLRGSNLSGTDLRGSNLYGADLYGANLYGAILRGADLSRANTIGAYLIGTDLSGAHLLKADLSEAYLYGPT